MQSEVNGGAIAASKEGPTAFLGSLRGDRRPVRGSTSRSAEKSRRKTENFANVKGAYSILGGEKLGKG